MSVLDKAFVKDDNLMARNIAGETLIVPIRNSIGDLNSIYTLNEVGARVWQLIDGQRSVNQIAAAISTEYTVDDSRPRRMSLNCSTRWRKRD